MTVSLLDRFRGSIIGLAIGDALGHPTEFIGSVAAIKDRFGPEGATRFFATGRHPPGTFTDDTQMTIAVARALIRAGHADLDALMTVMGGEFVAWARSPDNNRAPGGTCLTGCRNLEAGKPWREAGVAGSKGCGAAMRAAPVGLFFHDDDDAMVRVAAAQSVLTHGHPTGVASSVAAAAPVAWIAKGNGLQGMLAFTRSCVKRLNDDVLRSLGCTEHLIATVGIREMLEALDDTEAALDEEAEDVCELLGGAWIGEEAVATALWCVLKSEGDFFKSVVRGANSSGDSDSIACIAGSIAGALQGVDGLPAEWVKAVEKSEMLDTLSRTLHDVWSSRNDVPEPDASLDVFGVASRRARAVAQDADAT